jgi:hypothetical protein
MTGTRFLESIFWICLGRLVGEHFEEIQGHCRVVAVGRLGYGGQASGECAMATSGTFGPRGELCLRKCRADKSDNDEPETSLDWTTSDERRSWEPSDRSSTSVYGLLPAQKLRHDTQDEGLEDMDTALDDPHRHLDGRPRKGELT